MNLSFKQYKAVDLAIWAVILGVFEALATLAAKKWFPFQLYSLSPTITVLCIVMMRWGGFAAIHAVVGGAVFCIAGGADVSQFFIYCVGNCFSMLALLLFKALGKEKIRSKALFTVMFTAAVFSLAQIGRWLVSLFFGSSLGSVIDFFVTDPISLLFALVVVLISRNADGLFEDQKSYLIRTQDERNRQSRNTLD